MRLNEGWIHWCETEHNHTLVALKTRAILILENLDILVFRHMFIYQDSGHACQKRDCPCQTGMSGHTVWACIVPQYLHALTCEVSVSCCYLMLCSWHLYHDIVCKKCPTEISSILFSISQFHRRLISVLNWEPGVTIITLRCGSCGCSETALFFWAGLLTLKMCHFSAVVFKVIETCSAVTVLG